MHHGAAADMHNPGDRDREISAPHSRTASSAAPMTRSVRSKRKCDSREKELTRIVGLLNRATREENPITQCDCNIAGDAPVHKKIRLDAKVALRAGDLVNRRA